MTDIRNPLSWVGFALLLVVAFFAGEHSGYERGWRNCMDGSEQ